MKFLSTLLLFFSSALATSALAITIDILYDGRAYPGFDANLLDDSSGPYLTVVKGPKPASQYSHFITDGTSYPSPLWAAPSSKAEDVISISIDNSSVFVPGGDESNAQYGFRRTELIAQTNSSVSQLTAISQVGTTAFHFSIALDDSKPLNLTHEYQIVFIELADGSHVFEVQLGSPFTNPTGDLPSANAHNVNILDHASNVLFSAQLSDANWSNFAVAVDWDNCTLAVYFSPGANPLELVSPTMSNPGVEAGPDGQGEFHFGLLKLPLADPNDPAEERGDVVHHGIQEGTTEGLIYSAIFIEKFGASGPTLTPGAQG